MTTALLLAAHVAAAKPPAAAGVAAVVDPNVLLFLVPVGALTGIMWFKQHRLRHRGRRVLIWLFAVLAFLAVFGIASWLDALASLTTTKVDGAFLLGVDVVFGFLIGLHALKKGNHEEHYHVVYSHGIAVVFGTAAALTLADGLHLLTSLRSVPGGTASAISSTVKHVNSGAAAHATTPHGALTVIVIAAVVLLGLFWAGHRQHGTSWRPAKPEAALQLPPGTSVKREKKAKASDDGQARPILPRGSAGSGFSPARREN